MEYQGKRYTVLQGINGNWKWSVEGIEGFTRSGTAPSRAAGMKLAERAIDKALAPKKKRLRAPGSGEAAN